MISTPRGLLSFPQPPEPAVPFEEALTRAGLAVIATPPATHFNLASAALEAGCDVLCEKPFVPTSEAARKLEVVATSRGRALYVGHFRRMYASLRGGRDLLRSGVLGAPKSVTALEGGRFNWQAKSGYTHTDPHGGVLFDAGSHLIDMAMFLLGFDSGPVAVSVNEVERDAPDEPSHALTARLVVTQDDRDIDLRLGLSRFGLLANLIRVECDRGTLEVPIAPGSSVRLRGPDGTLAMSFEAGETTLGGGFIEQLRRITSADGCEELLAHRFIATVQILERLGTGE